MILGVSGACRREELYNITLNDIEDRDSFIIVKIPNTKTHIQRSFTITNKEDETIHYLEIIRKYIKLRPSHVKSSRLFLNFQKGKCTTQVVGKGTIGKWPIKIAEHLKLENPTNYTGHSFRRTSATLLANKGVDILGLKRHGGWKSSAVAESYVEDSLQNKIKFAEKILHGNNESSSANSTSVSCATFSVNANDPDKSTFPVSINNCNNCTFNFNVNK